MSDVMQGPGWWLASDGKWYPPDLREGTSDDLVTPEGATGPQAEDWWLASNGKWYPPELHPDAMSAGVAEASSSPEPSRSESASIARRSSRLGVDRSERSRDRTAGRPEDRRAARPASRSAPRSQVRRATRSDARSAARSDDGAGARTDHEEASLFRRYVGFVPELGADPEIRPSLRDPLPEPALIGSGTDEAGADVATEPVKFGRSRSGSSDEDLLDIEWGDWEAWEASKPDDTPPEPRGPRHAKGRRWLR